MASDDTMTTDVLAQLPPAWNVRDLGRMRTVDGRRIAAHRIYRGAFSTFVAEPGQAATNPLVLRAVVDLRRYGELAHESVDWGALGVRYFHCPLSNTDASTWSLRYPQYLENRPERVVAAIRALIDPANHPVLFHCAAGKDRTGVIAAMLLDLLGVGTDSIVSDYLQTGEVLVAILDRMRGEKPYREQIESSTLDALRPDGEALFAFLGWLARAGGTAAWLIRHGLSALEISTFGAVMLGPDTVST